MSETEELEALREQLATAHLHLRRAERVCALVGWTATRQDSDRDKALTQVWMDWCHHRPQMAVRRGVGAVGEDWPPVDLPRNIGLEEREYGVFEDRRNKGHGIALVEVTRDIDRAFAICHTLGMSGQVRSRVVRYAPWSSAIYDRRTAPTTPAETDRSAP